MADPVLAIVLDLFARMLFMAACVPEVAIDEDRDFLPCQCDIRRSRQATIVLAVAQPFMRQGFSQTDFWLRILAMDF